MANVYYARVDYIYEGGDTKFSVPFPYIDKKHIVAIINDDLENPITDLEFLTDNQVQINTKIMAGATVSIRRVTPLDDRFVDFTDGNILDEESQDLSALQVFDVVQEIKDNNDWLLSRMAEFTTLKELIDKSLASIENASNVVQQAFDMNSETKQLIDDITSTYEDLKERVNKGVNIYASHNLFEILVYDKILEGLELQGLAKQGDTVLFEEYPEAYSTLLNEYETGEKKVYTSEETVNYYRSFTGSESGEFYIPSDSNLEEGITVYSDEQCSQNLGTIEELTQIEADKYTGSITEEFYTEKDTPIVIDTQIYNDPILTKQLSVIEEIKSVKAIKYNASITGDFYIGIDQNIRVGRKIYSDEGLFNQSGTITKVDSITSDKYHITGLEDTDTFYVPQGTVLNVGTKIYRDSTCSDEIGTITNKGNITTTGVCCYNAWNYLMFNGWQAGYQLTSPFYTKSPINAEYQESYYDSTCNSFMCWVRSAQPLVSYLSPNREKSALSNISLISQNISSTSSNYIILNNNETKLTYYKQASVSVPIIAIDEGSNEVYEVKEAVTNQYIKLTDSDWQKYSKVGVIVSGSVKINKGSGDSSYESFTDNGIGTSEGVAFEYVEAANGHKIVDSKYKNKIDEFIQTNNRTEFYILNQTESNFILPILDNTKHIYFCVGNVVIVQANTAGITREQLNDILQNYVKLDNKFIQDLNSLLSTYNNTVGYINESLEDILGE